MKIALVSKFEKSPSTVLNRSLLEAIPNFYFFTEKIDLDSDVILFMGYDPKIEEARKLNPSAVIGIIDPRPGSEEQLKKADFYLANGVEMLNYFASSNPNYFVYPIYPRLNQKISTKNEALNLRIGYHGNKAHLQLMEGSVCLALNKLASELKKPIQLDCIYNYSQLGKWEWKPQSKFLKINHIQWTNTSYEEYLPKTDIGIVPNLIPFQPDLSSLDIQLENNKLAHDSDLFYRFKPTSNLGRILVFAQLGVAVISDMFPSSAEIIRHGYNGLLATDADSWYIHLKRLIENENERKKMADHMHEIFMNHYHWEVKNKELLEFFAKQIEFKRSQTRSFKGRIKQLFS